MLRLKYFPIYCVFTLMPALAYADDKQDSITVPVYYGFLNWKDIKSQKIAFPQKKISAEDFIKRSWKEYIKNVPQEKLTVENIVKDFGCRGLRCDELKHLPADKIAIVMQRKNLDEDRVGIMPYHKIFYLNNPNKKIGVHIEPIEKAEKSLQKSLKGKNIEKKYLLSSLIAEEKHEREGKIIIPLVVVCSLLAAIGMGYKIVGSKNKEALKKESTSKVA